MTGKDLIIYILANNLENEPVYKDGRFIGLLNVYDVANLLKVGPATVRTWVTQGQMDGMVIGGILYIPANFTSPMRSETIREE